MENYTKDLISAEEVRRRQDNFLQENIDSELSSIMKKIKGTTYTNNSYVIAETLHEHNIKKLNDLGYKVTMYQGDLISPNYYMISWR